MNSFYRYIILILCVLLMNVVSFDTYSQTKNVDWKALHEKMMNKKYRFLQKELILNDAQMKQFWAVYTQYDKEITACHDNARKTQCELTKTDPNSCTPVDEDKLSEDVAKQLIKQRVEMENALLLVKKKYSKEFEKVLPPQKVLKLHRLEKKFMREVMSKHDDKRANKKTNK